MTLNIILRSILISFLIAIPSPFIIEWLAGISTTAPAAITFFTVYVLAFIGCLLMGLTHGKVIGNNNAGEPSAAGADADHRESGTVKWFNVTKGFGFITRDSGEDVFVHYRSVRGNGRRTLREGQRVLFNVVEGEKGLQADDVSVAH